VTRKEGVILAGTVAIAAVFAAVAVVFTDANDWQPLELFGLLLALTVGSDLLTAELRGVRITGSFLALVLAMALLGPVPAVVIGVTASVVDATVARRRWDKAILNVANSSIFPVVGSLVFALIVGDVQPGEHEGLGFALVVVVVFMLTNFLNFALVAVQKAIEGTWSFMVALRNVFVPLLAPQFATALLTACVAFGYATVGFGAVGLMTVVMFVFQYLNRTGVQAHERGELLAVRTRELASLQVGLLSTVVQTLSMRDAMTARHSAAVARYAREVARMMGLPEREQELIHTAALLHDIGKFIFPDSILFADRKLTDDEWQTVKLHPEQGAKLLNRIQGYGPVAEIVLSHHEKFAGGGYPNGIAGDEIPLGSRIISAADTYDVMTSRDSYRRPVSSEAALAELQRVAGTQLDPQVVQVFTRMILERRVSFHHADEADFEQELGFERRVEDYARPRVAA
jgi:putative nucleotidyltransferase with HDIG domain